MARGSSEPAVLGKGLRVRGRVRGEGDLRVEASVEGDIEVSGALELAPGATVTGAVQAQEVVVSGALEGDVNATGPVTITTTGSLRGEVSAAELQIEEGGQLVGTVEAKFDLPDAIA